MRTAIVIIVLSVVPALCPMLAHANGGSDAGTPASTNAEVATVASAEPSSTDTNLPSMEVAEAIMVTVELDFGGAPPGIAEALRQVERRQEPEDGKGRVFAILDAYGAPTEDGKKLHISMHVSTEKPGVGSLMFRRTGEVLWKSRVVPATKEPSSAYAGKGLNIMIDDDKGKPHLLDGTHVTNSIFDATISSSGEPLESFWPEGEAREITLFYSACGCPVKVVARREGDKTVRLKDLPVIFPDDPSVAMTITKLMGWK